MEDLTTLKKQVEELQKRVSQLEAPMQYVHIPYNPVQVAPGTGTYAACPPTITMSLNAAGCCSACGRPFTVLANPTNG